jgi:protein phosphatase
MVESFGISDAGPVRPNNEDCFLAADDLAFFVVADGMGGHAAGEVASRVAVEAMEEFIRASRNEDEVTWPTGIDPGLSIAANRLWAAIHLANQRVLSVAGSRDDYTGMGTTVVAALVSGRNLVIGHVGDSRLYRFAAGRLAVETRDDTWAATILAGDDLEVERAASHPMRNVLTNVLGAREQAEIHIAERELTDGELVLLCTDGIHNALADDALRTILAGEGSLESIARGLTAGAIAAGSRDNVTAVVFRYRDDMHEPARTRPRTRRR